VRTVYSDIVVLAIAYYGQLGLSELWIAFDSGKNYRDVPVHINHSRLGPSKSLVIPPLSSSAVTKRQLGLRGVTHQVSQRHWSS